MRDRPVDANELEVYSVDECWGLLSDASFGHLAFVAQGEPQIRPVSVVVEDRMLFLVTRPGAKLDAVLAKPGGAAAFEADELDLDNRSGWSVIVRGWLHPVMNEVEQTRLDRLGSPAWIDMHRERRWLRFEPVDVTGRRFPGDS